MRLPGNGWPLLALACQATLLRIDIDESAQTVIPRGTVLEQLLVDFGFEDFVALDLTQAEELQNQGVSPGDIRDARLTAFTLTALAPAGADLDFLDALSVWVEAPDLPRVRIASLDPFPADTPSVDLQLDDVDLTPYLVSAAMTLTTEASGRRPDADTTLDATFALRVGVTGQGACNAIKGGD